jgi:hypothetical protein
MLFAVENRINLRIVRALRQNQALDQHLLALECRLTWRIASTECTLSKGQEKTNTKN